MTREATIDRRGRAALRGPWTSRLPVFPDRPWAPDDDAPGDATLGLRRKMRVLCPVASSNQMYSGVGRVLQELAIRTAGRIDWEFAIDDWPGGRRNAELLRAFGERHGMPVHVGRHERRADSCDPVNHDLAPLLRSAEWDAIELIGWANNATNAIGLEHARDATIVYTPHNQPLWTVPMSAEQAHNVTSTHEQLLRRADLVFAVSPAERKLLQEQADGRFNCFHTPNGCDFSLYRAGPARRPPQLLFVGDFREPRKRFDRVVEAFARVRAAAPEYRLVVVGNKTLEAGDLIPDDLRHAVTLKGYITEEELRALYAGSRGLFLLTDFEAFGIPILEALASGTPTFISRLPELDGLFGDFRGAHFCPQDDPDATAAIVLGTLARHEEAIAEATEDIPRLREAFDWDRIAVKKWQAMATAWGRKHQWSCRSW